MDAELELLKLEHWMCLRWQSINPVSWIWDNVPDYFDRLGKNKFTD